MSPTVASKHEIEQFLATHEFERRNARVQLPYGLSTPGKDMSSRFDQMFAENLTGKSVLDVGTYYGAFPAEAIARGAQRAVGIEIDERRFQTAKRIAAFNGNSYDIVHASAEDYRPDQQFDIVLVLNVLHHIPDPLALMTSATRACKDTVIVEFPDFNHPKVIFQTYRSPLWRYLGNSIFRWKGRNGFARLHSWVLKFVAGKLPLLMVGGREVKTTYYYSERAFYNAFVVHARLFSEVRFETSSKDSSRRVAFCSLRR